MLRTNVSSKEHFLRKTEAARQNRVTEKDREFAACCIQKFVRKWLNHKNFTIDILHKFDHTISNKICRNVPFLPAIEIYTLLEDFLIVYKRGRDQERMEDLYRYLIRSLDSNSLTISYIGISLKERYYILWILQMKKILCHCLLELKDLSLEWSTDYKYILVRLHTLISFTSSGTWAIMKSPSMTKLRVGMNQLCANIMGFLVNKNLYSIMKNLIKKGLSRANITLQPVALMAITTLTVRPLVLSEMSEKMLLAYLVHILSIPTLIHHIHINDKISILLYKEISIFSATLHFLTCESNLQSVFHVLKGSYTICLLANLLELANMEKQEFFKEIYFPNFTFVIINLLECCQQYVVDQQSNTTYWHPILGWFEQSEDCSFQELISIVKKQLSYLWTGNIINELMCKPLIEMVRKKRSSSNLANRSCNNSINIFQRKFSEVRMKCSNANKNNRFYSLETKKIASLCSIYYNALRTLREMKFLILTGLCYKDKSILHNLWLYLQNLGPNSGLQVFLDHLATNKDKITPEFHMLILFCDCMSHYITILDDIEMYEQQNPFHLSDFIYISCFLNYFIYKSVINNLLDCKMFDKNPIFKSAHSLLMAIYRRDCQKNFCKEDHWLIKDVRMSNFITDVEERKASASFLLFKVPHIIPHFQRVFLFRKYIMDEKAALGLCRGTWNSPPSILITIHRSSIVEDGCKQLSLLTPQALKGTIRVRFINEQGLDEAGIDQDGVFKEFLEETIRRVFDPSFKLFKVTNENRLYPSSASFLQKNHLLLFEFIGRMLGKAVYEGIVVDVPLASFFVSQFCGQTEGIFYSWLDELASFDADLYRSLTMVKHYNGDISNLNLTFSVDENVMEKIITYELKPGGKGISVTNENKIIYIHLMAKFRMHDQIREQIKCFIKGFRSIINSEWLSLFSTPEWQKLISGNNNPLNLRDLRRHTQYYGGFHDKHRVICWLWNILEKDFSDTEKGLFLKFVTSSSKSPLLGFSHLEPQFSIRCIEVGDDDDMGDTIGSVLRGFFTIRKKDPQNRLPTSSTCFNLLKLPNYQKKSTLRDKLRFAISSNTGFELS